MEVAPRESSRRPTCAVPAGRWVFPALFDNRQPTIYNLVGPLEWAKAIARKRATGGLTAGVFLREESPNWAGHGGW